MDTVREPVAGPRTYGYDDLATLMSLMTGDEKHDFSATSTLDVLWVLYDRVLRVTPETARAPGRDRFLLSKGHGPMAFYAVLAAKGFLDVDALRTFAGYDSRLGMHPDRVLVPGAEIGSGSLGHGLPLAVGMRHGLDVAGHAVAGDAVAGDAVAGDRVARVVVLVGDAELDEGSNHEAIAYAGAAGLAGLDAVVVDNESRTYGRPGGIAARFEAAGWAVRTVDGRDHDALERAFTEPVGGRPRAVVARVERRDGTR